METKDIVYALSIFLTFLIGVWNLVLNYRTTRKTSFINTVTSQRVKWIEQLRQDISSFSGLTRTWCFSELEGKPQEYEVLKEIDRLRHVIRLRLSPKEEYDRRIEQLIGEIPNLTHISQRDGLTQSLEELTVTSQKLLKQEWDKVKLEAEHGNLKKEKKSNAHRQRRYACWLAPLIWIVRQPCRLANWTRRQTRAKDKDIP